MRQNELLKGVDVFDADKNRLGCSKVYFCLKNIVCSFTITCWFQLAAAKGISQVVLSRIVMCAPGMGNFLNWYTFILIFIIRKGLILTLLIVIAYSIVAGDNGKTWK